MKRKPAAVDPIVSQAMATLGARGGSKTTAKQAAARRRNGSAPCAPGKKRGRRHGFRPKKKGEV